MQLDTIQRLLVASLLVAQSKVVLRCRSLHQTSSVYIFPEILFIHLDRPSCKQGPLMSRHHLQGAQHAAGVLDCI